MLVSLNIKIFLSFLIHILPAAQTGKRERRIPTVLEVGTGDASFALISCTFPQEPFPYHELSCSSSSSKSLNMAAGCCYCCCLFITTSGTSCSLLWYGWAMQNTSTVTKHDETNYCLSPSGVRALHWAGHRHRVNIFEIQCADLSDNHLNTSRTIHTKKKKCNGQRQQKQMGGLNEFNKLQAQDSVFV